VVAKLAEIVHDDDMINEFADRFMEWQSKEKETGALDGLEQRLKTNEAAIKNIMSVIDSGFITDSIKSHLIELEEERAALELGIAKEKMETPELERDHVVWFLERFRYGDQRDPKRRIFLVETFLQAAYLYDDGRLLLQLNYRGPNNTVSLELAEQVVNEGDILGGSSIALKCPPNGHCINIYCSKMKLWYYMTAGNTRQQLFVAVSYFCFRQSGLYIYF
jgi:site-specific DNA recombinase